MNYRFTFRVHSRFTNLKEVKAENYLQAAMIVARKIHGANHVVRLWGFPEFSGYFQAQIIVETKQGKQRRAVGSPFHLQRLSNGTGLVKDAYLMFDGLAYVKKHNLK